MLRSKLRTLLVVLGLLLLALFIWFAGPFFAFASYHPFASQTARVVLIVLMLACWVGSKLLAFFRANRASDLLMAALVKPSPKDERASPDAQVLRERFEDAVARLKKERRSGHSLYDLPWYVIIGPPGSGKTTALVKSGINLPVEQRSGKNLRGVGGTRNCDWWFADEAVFLDTAGRYLTQDSDPHADGAGWAEFLSLLKKYRGRRPINGVILTVSAHDLMTHGAQEREMSVAAARRRLDELNRELQIQLPVYVMVTKCDLLAGFAEYFDELTAEGRAQVWGTTFSYEQTTRGDAAAALSDEIDALAARLNARIFAKVDEERDLRRRTRIFGFPQQFASLRDSLSQFVTDVFSSTRFDQRVLLRGVYFTSGTQEGTPIDRVLGAIGRRLGVAQEAVLPSAGGGKAFFIERLLRDVIFAEAGLAGVSRTVELRKAAWQLVTYAALLLVAVVGVIAFSVSYARNRDYLARVAAAVEALRSVPRTDATGAPELALPRLDTVHAVFTVANEFEQGAPLAMRWGLFQGASIRNAARDAYVRELNGALLPQATEFIGRQLASFNNEPEEVFEYLKAYLMLGQPEHLDKAQLGFIADLEWQKAYGAVPERAAALSEHFGRLLEYAPALAPQHIDDRLVAQARSSVRQASVPRIMYGQLRSSYASDTARALRLDEAAGVGSDRYLARRSGTPLSKPVSSLYTAPAFKEIAAGGIVPLVARFNADRWVWGAELQLAAQSLTLGPELLDIYERDYIKFWDDLIQDIEPRPTRTPEEASELMAAFGAATSPLKGLLKTIDQHTYLVAQTDASKQSAAAAALSSVLERAKKITAGTGLPPGTRVTSHFAPVHRMVGGDAPAIDNLLAKFQALQQALGRAGTSVGAGSKTDPATIAAVSAAVSALRVEAALLPPQVGDVVARIADRAATAVLGELKANLSSRYQQDVVAQCRTIVSGRYPFDPMSAADVPPADFGRLFGYGGTYDTFFREQLEPLVDTSKSPWEYRRDASGTAVGNSVSMLRQFEAVQDIREMFFKPGQQTPELSFTLTVIDFDAAASRLAIEVDGQALSARRGGESLSGTWPGPKPGAAMVSFEESGGGQPRQAFRGPWAWLRLLDQARVEPERDAEYLISFQAGSRQARVRMDAGSLQNPYGRRELQLFRCDR